MQGLGRRITAYKQHADKTKRVSMYRERKTMSNNLHNDFSCANCCIEKVAEVQFSALRRDLAELRTRVGRLETALGRGVLLLVGNLVGVMVSLLHQML